MRYPNANNSRLMATRISPFRRGGGGGGVPPSPAWVASGGGNEMEVSSMPAPAMLEGTGGPEQLTVEAS